MLIRRAWREWKYECKYYNDMIPYAAMELAKKYGGKVYDTVDSLIMDESIDAVLVCTANVTTAEISMGALKTKQYVYVNSIGVVMIFSNVRLKWVG